MTSEQFFLLYFVPTFILFLLSLILPVRRYERWKLIAVAGILPLSVINNTVFTDFRGDTGDIPGSIAMDLIIIFLCYRLLKMRHAATTLSVLFISCFNILITSIRLNVELKVWLDSFMEMALMANALFITQVILVAFMCSEYILNRKGLVGIKPVNYFKIAREKSERDSSTGKYGETSSPTWRKLKHHHRPR